MHRNSLITLPEKRGGGEKRTIKGKGGRRKRRNNRETFLFSSRKLSVEKKRGKKIGKKGKKRKTPHQAFAKSFSHSTPLKRRRKKGKQRCEKGEKRPPSLISLLLKVCGTGGIRRGEGGKKGKKKGGEEGGKRRRPLFASLLSLWNGREIKGGREKGPEYSVISYLL